MDIDAFCKLLGDRTASLPSLDARLEEAARFICRAFSVKPDEVVIFSLDDKSEFLSFLWPVKLKDAGAIPLTAAIPLVVQTARENRGFLNNFFAVTPHASAFEQFQIGNSAPLPIQKIMSVPMGSNGKVAGVIQVCRKGEDVARAGSDFSSNELIALQRIAEVIARVL